MTAQELLRSNSAVKEAFAAWGLVRFCRSRRRVESVMHSLDSATWEEFCRSQWGEDLEAQSNTYGPLAAYTAEQHLDS